MQLKSLALAITLAVTGLFAAAPRAAHADSTCTSMVTYLTNAVRTDSSKYWRVRMTIHRTDVALTEYSEGWLQWGNSTTWPLAGGANQLFSDRYAGSQPFNINAADQLSLHVGPSGALNIYYSPWNFSSQWDMSCSGTTVMTKYIPGYGVVTLTFVLWSTIT